MGLSFFHILVVFLVILLLFGTGRVSSVMGDLGKGIRNFKAGLNGSLPEDKPKSEQAKLPRADDPDDSSAA